MKRFLASYFGLGFLPFAPGTWGSLPPVVVFGLLCYFDVSGVIVLIVMVLIGLDAGAGCIILAPDVIKETGLQDPPEVVVDEAAGQALTFIGAYATSEHAVLIALIGLAAFRFFDIIKPWPCRRLEKLPAGWGILCDDLAAGVYAAIVLQICIRFWIS